jgi:hypothetical protein
MVTNMHLVAIHNGAQDIQIDMIADIDVLAVAAVKGGSMIEFWPISPRASFQKFLGYNWDQTSTFAAWF